MKIEEKEFREFIARTERVTSVLYGLLGKFETKELNINSNTWDCVNVLEQIKNYKEQLNGTPKIGKWKQLKLI